MKKEVLTIDVHLTGRVVEEMEGYTQITLPFDGFADSPFFKGAILPGAADTQKWCGKTPVEFRAVYTLEGQDYTGADCRIHIVNLSKGEDWKPTVTTDSVALNFLNEAACTAILDHRKQGPIVHIYTEC